MLNQTNLHTNFRAARQRAGLTQAEMAKKMKLSQGYISQIESGNRTPTLGVLRAAASTTGTALSQLIEDE